MNFLEVEQNKVGHDWVVGDIHGCFDLLRDLLGTIGFDSNVDRLFSVGDLVDRGPESRQCLEWLDKPWFYAVRGNHEDLAIKYALACRNDPHAAMDMKHMYEANGGKWFIELDAERQYKYSATFAKLPLAIELDLGDGKAGLVHAEVPGDDWADFKTKLAEREHIDHLEHYALWGRQVIQWQHKFKALGTLDTWDYSVANIDVVYVGHSVVPEVTEIGNIRYVDTGAVFGKKLTVMNMHTGQSYEGHNE